MKNFRTYQMVKEFYKASKEISLAGPESDQFRRACLSIMLNLAEGSARPTVKDRKKFYFIALASQREVHAILDALEIEALIPLSDSLGAHLYRLCHA